MDNSRKLTVTVGIPAYNEEANIAFLVKNILGQKRKHFSLEKIIVVSDASVDKTEDIVSSFKSGKIDLIINQKRRGQTYCQNLIFSKSLSDTVVILEADTIPFDKNYLAQLLEPFLNNPSIGLVQGNMQPLPGKSLIEEVLINQFNIYHQYAIGNLKRANWFCSGRGGRSFSKKVYKKLVWPSSVPEDVYALLWCKKNHIKTFFQKSAICNYRCPQTIDDYKKERQKIHKAESSLGNYFPEEFIKNIYKKPFFMICKIVASLLYRNCFYLVAYLLIKILANTSVLDDKFSDFWSSVSSTKFLNG